MIDLNLNPSRKELKLFAVLQIVFFAIVAGFVYRRTGSTTAAAVIVAVAAVVGGIGFFATPFMRLIYVAWLLAVYPIGWTISHVLMTLIFFLVVTPLGLLMRLFGRDPMQRRFDPSARSYWQTRPPQQGTQQYFRQF